MDIINSLPSNLNKWVLRTLSDISLFAASLIGLDHLFHSQEADAQRYFSTWSSPLTPLEM